jgi:drug/metabolite transporter (DMT)-like permease
MLRPWEGGLTPLALLPILGGAFYACAGVMTRTLCAEEETLTLTAGFFATMGIAACLGLVIVPWLAPGGAGYLLGPPQPLGAVLAWLIAVQAVGSVLGISLLTRAYQVAPASTVSVLEYVLLPIAAGFAWLLWGQVPTAATLAGTVLIVAAGVVIVRRSAPEPVQVATRGAQ